MLDLAERKIIGGAYVVLYWKPGSANCTVAVQSDSEDTSFHIDCSRADAWETFHHPYLQAPSDVLERLSRPLSESEESDDEPMQAPPPEAPIAV